MLNRIRKFSFKNDLISADVRFSLKVENNKANRLALKFVREYICIMRA